jgi:hypothetical protein
MQNQIKNEIRDIISGKGQVRYGTIIQAATNHLGKGSPSSPKTEVSKQIREPETKSLEEFIFQNYLWIENIDFSSYVSEGAEQRVYLKDENHVLKLNDAIYYSTWKDYFFNLLLHNYFFPDTAYELLGFAKVDETLFAVIK